MYGVALCAALGAGGMWAGTLVQSGQAGTWQAVAATKQQLAMVAIPGAPVEQHFVDAAVFNPKPALKPCSTELAGAQPGPAQVGNLLKGMFGITNIGGRNGEAGDHGRGLALDFMTNSFDTGTKLADFVLANQDRFGVTYVIWRQRYNDGHGWSMMENRGSPTANHMDHVHVSFRQGAQVFVSC